jgi:hypothetical protein
MAGELVEQLIAANYGLVGLMLARSRSDWYSVCSARLAQRSAIESSMARISGFVVDRIASRQCAAFCFQGVCMGQASIELITYPLKISNSVWVFVGSKAALVARMFGSRYPLSV